jgi:hypothetical protein
MCLTALNAPSTLLLPRAAIVGARSSDTALRLMALCTAVRTALANLERPSFEIALESELRKSYLISQFVIKLPGRSAMTTNLQNLILIEEE